MASDSLPALTWTLSLGGGCPGPREMPLSVTCSAASISPGVALYAALSSPGPFDSASCTLGAALAGQFWALPLIVRVGAVFGTRGGPATLSCAVRASAGSLLAWAEAPLSVAGSVWPTWGDAILVGGTGATHSWAARRAADAAPALLAALAASPRCSGSGNNASSLLPSLNATSANCSGLAAAFADPMVVLAAVAAVWDKEFAGNPPSRDAPFSMTVTGSSSLVLRSQRTGAFPPNVTAVAGELAATVPAVSADGRWVLLQVRARGWQSSRCTSGGLGAQTWADTS